MSVRKNKAPFPYFGGKSKAAPVIWAALGDVAHYAEPFAGSLATLLLRPHQANRAYYSESVNDMDGLLVNAWRSIQMSPTATAEAASWPVSEADLHARHIALVNWRDVNSLELLMGDPEWHDPKMGGWWLWGQSSWIGSGWCSGTGAWTVDASGRMFKQARGKTRAHGVDRKRPHLSNAGQGVNHPGTREPGVDRKRPHLSDGGMGVNHAGTREPGAGGFHPMAMPELIAWFEFLAARLRHVRIINGDWSRLCTGGALKTLNVRMGDGVAGVFLDPPYLHSVRDSTLYAVEGATLADDVRAWCLEHGPDPKYRIVLAGFDDEHHELVAHGWREVEWFKAGFLQGGMANAGAKETQQKRERLWLSPHCITEPEAQTGFSF